MGRQRLPFDVTLKHLIDSGLLQAEPKSMRLEARSKVRKGDLLVDGTIFFEGRKYQSASSFAVAALRSAGAKNRNTANGWQLVVFKGKTLEAHRAKFIKDRWGISPPLNARNPAGTQQSPLESESEHEGEQTPITVASSTGDPGSSLSGTQEPCSLTASGSQTQVSSDTQGVDCSTETSLQLFDVHRNETSTRKRGPSLALQMWLKKALKKRHIANP